MTPRDSMGDEIGRAGSSPPAMTDQGASGWSAALFYSVASLGLGGFYGFNNATLPLILSRFTDNPLLIGLLSNTRSIEGAFLQPLIGAWSDRLRTPLGRRRPFMLVGLPLAAFGLLLAARAPTLPLLVAAVIGFSLCFNVAVDPYVALLADRFPPARRSAVNGVAALASLVGTILALLGAAALAQRDRLPLAFALVAAVLLGTGAVTVATVREPPAPLRPGTTVRNASPRANARAFVATVLRHRAACRLLLVLFCYRFGVNAIVPYLTLFAVRVIGTDEATAQLLFLGLILTTAVAVVPAGLLAARLGRRPVLRAGIALTVVAALGGLAIRDVPQTLAVVLCAGLGNAAITAIDWPLLTELVPATEVGLFAGLKAASESVALPVAVALASALIGQWGYRACFVVVAAGALAALGLVRLLTETMTTPPA